MKISLLYTSRRPERVKQVAMQWLGSARDKYALEFIFTADEDDRATAEVMLALVNSMTAAGISAKGPFPCALPSSAAKGWNLAAEKSTGDVLIAIADDFEARLDWDLALCYLESMAVEIIHGAVVPKLSWWQREAVVLVSDTMKRACLCVTLPIISRPRYRRLGYVYHPAYPSMWNDNELAEHAANDGVLIDATHLVFPQSHYVNGKRRMDAVDRNHSSRWHFEQGRRIFEARKALGFPLDTAASALQEARVGTFDPIAYILTAGDDFALKQGVMRLRHQGVTNFFFSIPDKLWNGEAINKGIERVRDMIEYLALSGCEVWTQNLTVDKYKAGKPRLMSDIEGRARNAALAEIQELGFRDVLIVDDDEIWPYGLLANIKAEVETKGAPAIHCNCTPIVAGLPVEGSKDFVGVYIDAARNRFLSGRAFYKGGEVLKLEEPILHFTATRRTRNELIEKMLTSAHFDDPDYNFTAWINRLPTLRPGSQNVHMYQKGANVWPRLREWTKEELESIPVTLHQYLWL